MLHHFLFVCLFKQCHPPHYSDSGQHTRLNQKPQHTIHGTVATINANHTKKAELTYSPDPDPYGNMLFLINFIHNVWTFPFLLINLLWLHIVYLRFSLIDSLYMILILTHFFRVLVTVSIQSLNGFVAPSLLVLSHIFLKYPLLI